MKKTMIVLCGGLLLLLAACGNQPGAASSPVTDSTSAVTTTQAPATSLPPSESASLPASALPIPGIDKDHYPWIDGSTANHPLLARIYREICGVDRERSETMVNFDLGSTGSIWQKMLSDKKGDSTPDLWIVYEAPEDVKKIHKKDFDDFEIEPLGRDALVFMVNVQNPVENLSVQQLYDIYTGKLSNWKEVGGKDEPIIAFQRNADSGSQTLFMKLLMQGKEPMKPPTNQLISTMGMLIDQVAAYDGQGSSLGFSVFFYATLMHANPALKLLSVDGVAPENESILKGKYPLTNDFYVVIRKSEPADSPVRALRDWLLSEEGRRILEEEQYVWGREGLD